MPFSILEMLNTPYVKNLLETFAFSTGMGVVLTDEKGRHIGAETNFCDFCKLINKESAEQCYRSNSYALGIALQTKKPFVYVCHAGRVDMIMPLFSENRLIGSLMAGQILVDNPEKLVRAGKFGMLQIDNLLCSAAFLPGTRKKIRACAQMLPIVADLILNHILQGTKDAEGISQDPKKEIYGPSSAALSQFSDTSGSAWLHYNFMLSRLLSVGEIELATQYINNSIELIHFLCVPKSHLSRLRMLTDMLNSYISLMSFIQSADMRIDVSIDEATEELQIPTYSLIDLVAERFKYFQAIERGRGRLSIRTKYANQTITLCLVDAGKSILPVLPEKYSKVLRRKSEVELEELPTSFKKAIGDLLHRSPYKVVVEIVVNEQEYKVTVHFAPNGAYAVCPNTN